jgi:hypothetical protein
MFWGDRVGKGKGPVRTRVGIRHPQVEPDGG